MTLTDLSGHIDFEAGKQNVDRTKARNEKPPVMMTSRNGGPMGKIGRNTIPWVQSKMTMADILVTHR